MIRNITFTLIGLVAGALAVYAIPSTCDIVIDQTGSLLDMGKGLLQGASE